MEPWISKIIFGVAQERDESLWSITTQGSDSQCHHSLGCAVIIDGEVAPGSAYSQQWTSFWPSDAAHGIPQSRIHLTLFAGVRIPQYNMWWVWSYDSQQVTVHIPAEPSACPANTTLCYTACCKTVCSPTLEPNLPHSCSFLCVSCNIILHIYSLELHKDDSVNGPHIQ